MMLDTNKTVKEISQELDIPESSIKSHRHKHGIYTGKVFNPNIEEFISLYNKLNSAPKVGKHYGVCKTTVLHFAQKIGYDTSRKDLLTEEEIKYILDHYDTPSSILADQFNVSISLISKIWNTNGLLGKIRRTYTLDEHCFDNIYTEEQAYFLGFLAADGCLFETKDKNKQNILHITIQNQDSYILDSFNEKIFKTNKPIAITKKKYSTFEISSNRIYHQIYNLGLHPNKTYGNSFVKLDDKLMNHFIRGYFDGDGSITKNGKWNNSSRDINIYISGFRTNMDAFSNYLEKYNIFSNFVIDKRTYNGEEDFGAFTLTSQINKYAFLKYLYKDATMYLHRKHNLADIFIKSVENCYNIRDKNVIAYYKYAVNKVKADLELEETDRGGIGSTGVN